MNSCWAVCEERRWRWKLEKTRKHTARQNVHISVNNANEGNIVDNLVFSFNPVRMNHRVSLGDNFYTAKGKGTQSLKNKAKMFRSVM